MAYDLIKTDPFQQDLDSVIGYITLVLKNKVAAASLLDSVQKCYDEIERMPLMYEACRDPYLKSLGYRKAIIHNYVMVYKVDEEHKTVHILRFFHGSQDYEKLI
jgi:plasmid stabilization system protein ParE